MSAAVRVEQAFAELERHSESTRALLQRVLMAALREPAIVAAAQHASVVDHLRVLTRTLHSLPIRSLHVCPVLPDFSELVERFPTDVFSWPRDLLAAQAYLGELPRPLRERVVWVVSAAQPELISRHFGSTPCLELFVRLAGLALADLPFLLHVLEGEVIEPFLGSASSAPPQSASRMRRP